MINPIAMHDQVLSFIQNEALFTEIDGGLSYDILANRFQYYWRQRIAQELEFLETPTNISSDYYGATRRTKFAAIAIVKNGIPDGII